MSKQKENENITLIMVNVNADTVGSENAEVAFVINGGKHLTEKQDAEIKELLSKASAIAIDGLRGRMQSVIGKMKR